MSNSSGGGRTRLGADDDDASGEDVSVASSRRFVLDIAEGRVIGQPTTRTVLSS